MCWGFGVRSMTFSVGSVTVSGGGGSSGSSSTTRGSCDVGRSISTPIFWSAISPAAWIAAMRAREIQRGWRLGRYRPGISPARALLVGCSVSRGASPRPYSMTFMRSPTHVLGGGLINAGPHAHEKSPLEHQADDLTRDAQAGEIARRDMALRTHETERFCLQASRRRGI